MNFRNPYFAIVISIFFHLGLFIVWNNTSKNDKEEVTLSKGGIRFQILGNNQKGFGENSQKKQEIETLGNLVQKEIDSFKNQLGYPESALDRELETECEWKLVIGDQGKPSRIINIKECEYSIFKEHFERQAKEWKFSLPENTVLIIPVVFRVSKK
ncbi:MAG: hypothetical protein SFU98_08240 [Leptospiraceae bacterium]|nr:hypothetical protein [Leptospiraceae bacterium]